MSTSSGEPDGDPWQGLTAKQCQVLDLLIEHKTSKEISRLLGISPHTVDQRILLARAKLNVTSRSEVAQAYRRLLSATRDPANMETYRRSIYGSSDLASPADLRQSGAREAAADAIPAISTYPAEQRTSAPFAQMARLSDEVPGAYHHVLPAVFDGRGGTLLRLGAIAVITASLTLIILGGLAMYTQLAHMLDG